MINQKYWSFYFAYNRYDRNLRIRFTNRICQTTKNNSEDEDGEFMRYRTIVPFQIAYAVSIHKAQGLEYNSVKIIITDEVEECITHNIFYTAITRAREKLKIYWTPEVEEKVLNRIKPKDVSADVEILQEYLKE